MSEPTVEATEETATGTEEPKPTETADFWKSKSREWESKAKANKSAADELEKLKDSQKTEAERAAEKLTKAEAEAATVPAKVAGALKAHLVALHGIGDEDAELFLTAQDPEVLLKQADRLVSRSEKKPSGPHAPREGNHHTPKESEEAAFVSALFGGQ